MEIVYLVQARRVFTEGGDAIDTWMVRAESAKEARQKVARNRAAFGEPPYYSMKVRRGLEPDVWGCLVMQEKR